ncbi:MAG: type II secretion system GspH family protein, partial [Candidatus Omnitrophica bacterium]|nr:type II secretion system GspH family protein [Candidatus Omnitrophota bacterium]
MKLKNERRTTPCLPAGRNHERRGKNEWRSRSFTLIEFIVVITIVGILTVGLSTYIIKGIDLWQLITFRNEITASGRLALFRMGREIKRIKNDLSVHIASASRFKFDDVNSSSIDYQLSSSNLKRNSD